MAGRKEKEKRAHLEDATGLFVDQARDTLDTTTTSETTNGRLGDTLDVVTKDLAVPVSRKAMGKSTSANIATARRREMSLPLSTALAETFTAFSTTGHCC
jgi:3-hydroxyisobutyrate dehydrogenase-like beta-hydroxyacid dehydrogenase